MIRDINSPNIVQIDLPIKKGDNYFKDLLNGHSIYNEEGRYYESLECFSQLQQISFYNPAIKTFLMSGQIILSSSDRYVFDGLTIENAMKNDLRLVSSEDSKIHVQLRYYTKVMINGVEYNLLDDGKLGLKN